VAKLARLAGAPMVINTDSHSPGNLIDLSTANRIALGAGLTADDFNLMQENAAKLIGLRVKG